MRLQIFKNNKGIIYGTDPKRITCDIGGVLKIGSTKIEIEAGQENIFPLLFNGSTGRYKASFTSEAGNVYEIAEVTVKGGRVLPPSQVALEFMELRCRIEALEDTCDEQEKELERLNNIFDTNSLNFIIKGEETK